jgi:hypothetical protein
MTLEAPTGFTATPGNTFVHLTWDPYPDPSITILLLTLNGTTQTPRGSSEPFYNWDGLPNDIACSFSLAALDTSTGLPGPSVTITATPSSSIQLEAPQNLTATRPLGFVSFAWSAVPGATNFEVYVNGSLYQTVSYGQTDYSLPASDELTYEIGLTASNETSTSPMTTITVEPSKPQTIAGALRNRLTNQVSGLSVFRGYAPEGTTTPVVVIHDGIAVNTRELSRDTWYISETVQVDLYDETGGDLTLPDRIHRALHHAQLITQDLNVFRCAVTSRAQDPTDEGSDDNVVRTTYTLNVVRSAA